MSQAFEPTTSRRALIVEDEHPVAAEIRERLLKLGLREVEIVPDSSDAITATERLQPDLIFMDVRLKGAMDGIQTARAIAQRHSMPVIYIAGQSDRDALQRLKNGDHYSYVLKPFRDRDLAVAVEVATQRHALERRLRESEARFEAMIDSISDCVVAADSSGLVTFINPGAAELTGWTLDEARELPVSKVLPLAAEDGEVGQHPILKAIETGGTVDLSKGAHLITRAGQSILVEGSASPIISGQRQMIGAILAFRDIRPRKRSEEALRKTEEQLRQSQKMEAIGQLAGGVAHDFNNLLTVITGYSDILVNELSLDAKSQEMAAEIQKAGDRAAALTRHLLAFSRRQVLHPTRVQLGALITELSRLLTRLIGEDMILTTRSAPDLWFIQADRGQIEQAIMNLVVNARDAMPNGGRLSISCQNLVFREGAFTPPPTMGPGDYVLLTVGDTGVGMSEETQARIYEPFFTTKERGKGTGLGLSTVYGIVKQSGGFIDVRSELGKGTTFSLYFPKAANDLSADPLTKNKDAILVGEEAILLVEDDQSVRALAAAGLRQYGYTVFEAENGKAALRQFMQHSEIQLLLTDIVLRGMNGREIAEKIKAMKPEIRVLYMSGYTDDMVVRSGVIFGDAAFVQKPFTGTELARSVREALDQ
ncbi:MAG TPA: response regulator [Terriglobia bacterium]|nr:response regulator [Terriglobia bacterium]